MMLTRRQFIFVLGAASIGLIARAASASQPTVEVIALGHSPVQNALKPVREVLAKYAGKVRVVDLDAESPEGEKRLKAVGLKGHIPIAIFIDGNKSYKLPSGKSIEFVNFPAAAGNPMGLNGAWTVADFETALRTALGEK
jgi:hypothetical protein